MSQKTVQWLIGRLLSDEECRVRFLRNPLATLVALRDQGYELTEVEIGALLRTDRSLWIDGARRLDSRLQRCQVAPAGKEDGGLNGETPSPDLKVRPARACGASLDPPD